MRVGSYVVPIEDYSGKLDDDFYCKPFYPNPNTICTVKFIGLRKILGVLLSVLEVEETAVFAHNPKKYPVVFFDPSHWREIDIPELTEEITDELRVPNPVEVLTFS